MAMLGVNFKGASVAIHDAQGNALAQTIITEYDANYRILQVKGIFDKVKRGDAVNILVILPEGIYEFSGVVRGIMFNETQIALAKGGVKENRAAKRYPMNVSAVIERLIVNAQRFDLPIPVAVQIRNLSTTGVCFSARHVFRLKSKMEFKLKIGDEEIVMPITVVRLNRLDDQNNEYGCRFGL